MSATAPAGPRGRQGQAAADLGERRLPRHRGARSRSSPSTSSTPPTCARGRASSTWRAAAATPRWPPRAAGRRSCRSTTCRRCSSARRSAPRAEGLTYETVVGDAEALPFDDASFDAVDLRRRRDVRARPPARGRELLRVCRPGGTIALASWCPDSFIGELFRTTAAHVPPPAGLQPPGLWGTEDHVALAVRRRRQRPARGAAHVHVALPLAAALVDTVPHLLRADAQGVRGARRGRPGGARRRPRRPRVAADRLHGEDAVAVPADYLEVVATRA